MDKPKVTPKDFFLWAGAMIALYWSIFALITLLFSYINQAFPDALSYEYFSDPYSGGMRFAMASLIVFFPLYLYLMRVIRKDIARDESRYELWVRRWLIVFTIFVAGLTVAGDLVTLINYFLGGEITIRFVLKVLVILLIAAGVLMHFIADMWGYWKEFPEKARMVGWGAGVLVLASIVSGFFIMGTPGQIRLYRFDDQKVQDLTNIQYQVVNYYQQKGKLPATLEELVDPLSGNSIPTDPQSRDAYKYSVKSPLTFELCATFNAETQRGSQYDRSVPTMPSASMNGEYYEDLYSLPWTHEAGEKCFTRTIDPDKYPLYKDAKGL